MPMNADAFRHFYEYHFTVNRKIWDESITQLSPEQFSQPVNYSHGSVRDQLWHLIRVDEAWFSDLSGAAPSQPIDPGDFPDRESMRAYWDNVEQHMRGYLSALQDDMLATKPLSGEDKDLRLWQVLLHVVNHGTDHRAQLLRVLNDLGVQTTWQDYIFFVYGNPE